jgi:hypothetical protein
MSSEPKTYTPRPGSLVERISQHLQQHGGTLTSSQIASLFGTTPNCVMSSIRNALDHGHLRTHTVEGSRALHVSLGDVDSVDAAEEAKPRKAARGPRKAGTGRRRAAAADSDAAADDLDAQDAAADPADAHTGPVACMWDDGDIVLHQLVGNADGSTATITEAYARRLHSFLDRLYGAPEARP